MSNTSDKANELDEAIAAEEEGRRVYVTSRGVPYIYPSAGGPIYASSREQAVSMVAAGLVLAQWWDDYRPNQS